MNWLLPLEDFGGRTQEFHVRTPLACGGSNRTRLTYPDSTYITYAYDGMNRLTTVKSQGTTTLAQYTPDRVEGRLYDWRSRREKLDYGNGTRIEYLYDVASRMISVDNIATSGSHEYAYGYDNVGNRTSMTVTNGGTEVHTYVYDGTYQITDVDYPAAYGDNFTDTQYAYDAAGNRVDVNDASGLTSYETNNLNQYSTVGGLTYTYDDSGNLTFDGDGLMYAYDPENRLKTATKIDGPFSAGCDIALSFTSGGDATWSLDTSEYNYDHDSAKSGDIGNNQQTWFETTVTGPGELRFAYKLSCDSGDEYAFSIDGQYKTGRAGSYDWHESGPWTITGAGPHTIRWKYIKDGSGSEGSDCLWIDHVRWTGAMPDGAGWDVITYVYDAEGRRVEKKYDGVTQVKFVYDGDQCVAEYSAAGTLLRKYIYGPGIDEPICMIEASGGYAGTYYYHFDALGSVVGLTNSSGNMVELYEYSVYGQVAASDADHPNRFMFTGREFDKETGLYYYRARYYHPEIGRFLQIDPIGYCGGTNMYRYCRNNPWNLRDPSGLRTIENKGEVTWGCGGWFPVAWLLGTNNAWVTLAANTTTGLVFDSEPQVTYDMTHRRGWKEATMDIGQPVFYRKPNRYARPNDPNTGTIDCYKVTAHFKWTQGWSIKIDLPWPLVSIKLRFEDYMETTMTVHICADGINPKTEYRHSTNGARWCDQGWSAETE